ncbi:hypothetical protein [Streptomyces sp. NPDC051776]|uniref:hypothetical protein n=1 Tax=Streptomyces sp. NPDC051776 TaxID=3155414 RepID=UPI00343C444E
MGVLRVLEDLGSGGRGADEGGIGLLGDHMDGSGTRRQAADDAAPAGAAEHDSGAVGTAELGVDDLALGPSCSRHPSGESSSCTPY